MSGLLSTDALFGTAPPQPQTPSGWAPTSIPPATPEEILANAQRGGGYMPSPEEAKAMSADISARQPTTKPQSGILSSEDLFGSAPPSPAEPPLDPNDASASMPYRLAQAGLRGMTAGLSDKAQAASHAAGRSIMDSALSMVPDALRPSPEQQEAMRNSQILDSAPPPGSTPQPQQGFGDVYRADLAKERAQTEAFGQEHPIAAGTAYTGGMLASAPLLAGKAVAGAGTLAKMLQGAKVGAGVGAASGFAGTNDTSLAEDVGHTAIGAAGGAAIGAAGSLLADKILGPAIGYVAQKFFPGRSADDATARIADAMAKDAAGAINPKAPSGYGMPLDEYIAGLKAKLQAAGDQPLTLADVGGENLKGLLGSATRTPGPGKQFATEFLDTRDEGAGPRLTKIVNDRISNGAGAFSTREALETARNAAAMPLRQQAFLANQNVVSPAIDKMLATRPDMQRAFRMAVEDMRNQGKLVSVSDPELTELAREQGISTGHGVGQGLKLEVLDYTKRALDRLIRAYKQHPETGDYATAVKMRQELVRALDEADVTARAGPNSLKPEGGLYKQYRNTYSGPTQSLEAMEAGQSFLSKEPDAIKAEIAKLSAGDRDFYLQGAAQTLRNRIANVGEAGNEGDVIAGKELIRQRLRPLFKNDADYDHFIASAKLESLMAKTRYQTTGNSMTAKRGAEDALGGHGGNLGQVLTGTGIALAGEPAVGSYVAAKGGVGLLRDLRQLNPASNLQVATQMLRSSPQERATTLADILANQTRRRSLPLGTIPLSTLIGSNPSTALALPFALTEGHSQ